MRIILFLYAIYSLISCVPPSEQNVLDISIDLSSEAHQSIIEAQDKRDEKSIEEYLFSENVTERILATAACASIQSINLSNPLFNLLNTDPSPDVRKMAAYALGQQGDESLLPKLISSFGQQDTSEYNTPIRGAILEAIGKCGDKLTLELISGVSTYSNQDNHLLLGQARAIYRFGLRNIYSEKGTSAMINRLLDSSIPAETRLIAAHYIARNPALEISENISRLTGQLINEGDVNIRMALAGAITSRGDFGQLSPLLSMLRSDPDYRVRLNILRNLSSYDYPLFKSDVISLLETDNEHIFELASTLLQNNAPRQEAGTFLALAESEKSNYRKASFLGVALNSLPGRFINTRRNVCDLLVAGLEGTNIATEQVKYIDALSLDPFNLSVIIEKGLKSPIPLVKTNSILNIKNILSNQRTLEIYNRPSEISNFRTIIIKELTSILKEGDPGSIAAIATLIRDEKCGFKEFVGLNLTLRTALRKLKMPQDYEAKKECLLALNYLEDTTYVLDPISYNHDIDWSLLEDINDSSRAFIITTKGQIEIQLFKNHAPGSVSNFIALSQSNFYDSKTIHRVVPNFVVQGGCPRGDGYGSLDYSIRSELGPKYFDTEGYIGMASAGRDTEGTQWFITHSPTLHLDGKYTIFGKVSSGMNVVHSLRPGDVIQDVRVLKY